MGGDALVQVIVGEGVEGDGLGVVLGGVVTVNGLAIGKPETELGVGRELVVGGEAQLILVVAVVLVVAVEVVGVLIVGDEGEAEALAAGVVVEEGAAERLVARLGAVRAVERLIVALAAEGELDGVGAEEIEVTAELGVDVPLEGVVVVGLLVVVPLIGDLALQTVHDAVLELAEEAAGEHGVSGEGVALVAAGRRVHVVGVGEFLRQREAELVGEDGGGGLEVVRKDAAGTGGREGEAGKQATQNQGKSQVAHGDCRDASLW